MEQSMDQAPIPFGPLRNKSRLPVVFAGLITSSLGLAAVWWLGQSTDFNIMLFYYAYIFPLGALLVGAVCGSGYGLGSYFTGVRISKSLLLIVVLLQVAVYFVAQYLEYLYIIDQASRSQGPIDINFFEYFDYATRQFSFQNENSNDFGDPMGAWGYAFRALEISGFVFGGLIAPLVLKSRSYCEQCQVYMRKKPLLILPASVPFKKIKRKDTKAKQAFELEMAQANESALSQVEILRHSLEAGKVTDLLEIQKKYESEKTAISKLPVRISISLDYCPICSKGILVGTKITRNKNHVQSTSLGNSSVESSAVKELLALKS